MSVGPWPEAWSAFCLACWADPPAVLHARVLGSLVYGALELGVGVGHLLDLGLRILRELLHELCELGVVALHLAHDPAHRLPEEVLGLLQDCSSCVCC